MTKTHGKQGVEAPVKEIKINLKDKDCKIETVVIKERQQNVTKYNFISKDKDEYNFIKKDKIDYNLMPKDVTVLNVVEKKKEIEIPELNTQVLQDAVRRAVMDVISKLDLGGYIKGLIKEQMKDVRVPNLVPFDFKFAELKPFDFPYPELKPFNKPIPVIVEGETITRYNFIKKDKIDWNLIKRDKVITEEVKVKV